MLNKSTFSIIIIVISLLTISPTDNLVADEFGSVHVSYIREVSNQLFLSDFQIGSEETIRDLDGHGTALGFLFGNKGYKFFQLDMGYSTTSYKGTIEDGVNVAFSPQANSGFDTLSTSKDILYEFDLNFKNPYIAISYTNWELVTKNDYLYVSTIGVGLIFQEAKGEVIIKSTGGVEIAKAHYESGTQMFYSTGWSYNYDFLFVSLLFRNVTSPILIISKCNTLAVGEDACNKIKAATGNRNATTQLFNGGVLTLGVMF